MTAIQPLLIFLLLAGTVVYFRWLRSGLLDRLMVILIAAVGVGLVANPELTTRIAHRVGVGRGVDLVFYIALFGLGFSLLLIFSKLRDLEARLTEVARAQALACAKLPPAES
jgi:hypothetical protein